MLQHILIFAIVPFLLIINYVQIDLTNFTKIVKRDIQLEEKVNNEQDINKLYNLAVEESDRITYPLSFGWGIVSHLNSVKNND